MKTLNNQIALVIPVYNEAAGIGHFHACLVAALAKVKDTSAFTIYYVNDGSDDDSAVIIKTLPKTKKINFELVNLSRNFGKEAAISAGIKIAYESGCQAIITLDADGQHPVESISDFITAWKQGVDVVVGVRTNSKHEGIIKRVGSKAFYNIFNKMSGIKLIPGSTDYRLISRQVAAEFTNLTERSRITRGLIDWLGFKRSYIKFDALERQHGNATYSTKKLLQLALNSFISLSILPLYLSGYLGIVFMCTSFLGGVFIFVEQFILGDPLNFNISGPVIIGIIIVFLVGIILSSIGLLALYIAKILEEVQSRPLYIIKDHTISKD